MFAGINIEVKMNKYSFFILWMAIVPFNLNANTEERCAELKQRLRGLMRGDTVAPGQVQLAHIANLNHEISSLGCKVIGIVVY